MTRKYNIINIALNQVVATLHLSDLQAFPLLYAQIKVYQKDEILPAKVLKEKPTK